MSDSYLTPFEDKHIAQQAFLDYASGLEDLPPIERLYRLTVRDGLPDHLTQEQAGKFHGLCSNETLGIFDKITKEILELNGLRKRKYPCSLPDIARLSASPAQWETFLCPLNWDLDHGVLDHLTGAENQEGRAAALISHTHKTDIDIDDLRQMLSSRGIELTVPGSETWGSWYSPGSTLPLVFHHPSIRFRFPSWVEEAEQSDSQDDQSDSNGEESECSADS